MSTTAVSKSNKTIFAADLFCGGGGTSTGLWMAAADLGLQIEWVAVNHWDVAIDTIKLNHPGINIKNSDLERLDPAECVPNGYLDLLVASPECTHFSRASGGKPKNKQSRASIKYILKWVNALNVQDVLIENVPEFVTWGPLHRTCTCSVGLRKPESSVKHEKKCVYQKPIQARKGEYFYRFVNKMQELGYAVKWRVLTTADYGNATTRQRLFIMARKTKGIIWPKASHHKHGGDMFESLPKWPAAREIIDWAVKGKSIFNRKTPLVEKTLKRISTGLMKYSGSAFVLGQQSGSSPRSVNSPLPTIATAGKISLIEPFIVQMDQGGAVHSIDLPMPTITSADSFALIDPFIVEYYGTGTAQSVDEPLNTITSRDRFALIEPIVFQKDGKQYLLDIRHRMLMPSELAAAMGFPKEYIFTGSRENMVKQIGNAVPVGMARALCRTLISTLVN